MKKLLIYVLVVFSLFTVKPVHAMEEATVEPCAITSEVSTKEEVEYLFKFEEAIVNALLTGQKFIDISHYNLDSNEYSSLKYLRYFTPYACNGIDVPIFYNVDTKKFGFIMIDNPMSLSETREHVKAVKAKVDEIKGLLSENYSDEKNALILYDYLVLNTEYDVQALNDTSNSTFQDTYRTGGLIMNNKATCQGYTFAYKYFLNLIGMQCHFIVNYDTTHGWNVVNIDGKNYHVDVTFGDPIPDKVGRVDHKYFLKSDTAISDYNHIWFDPGIYCTSTKYDDSYLHDITSEVVYDGNTQYYVTYEDGFVCRNGTKTTVINELGKWYTSGNQVYKGKFSTLIKEGNCIYFNTQNEVIEYNIKTKEQNVIYSHPYKIFGMENRNGDFYIVEKVTADEVGLYHLFSTNKDMPFRDVAPNSWYYNVVLQSYQLGLLSGATETLFKPNANMNRAMVAIVFHRMEGSKKVDYKETFSDVPNGQYYTTSVLWAKQAGIINGYSDGTFKPMREVTREEMATMLYNLAKYKGISVKASLNITGYSDYYQITSYARAPMQWAVEKGLMSGKLNGTKLDPLGLTTRAEASKMLVNVYKLIYK